MGDRDGAIDSGVRWIRCEMRVPSPLKNDRLVGIECDILIIISFLADLNDGGNGGPSNSILDVGKTGGITVTVIIPSHINGVAADYCKYLIALISSLPCVVNPVADENRS